MQMYNNTKQSNSSNMHLYKELAAKSHDMQRWTQIRTMWLKDKPYVSFETITVQPVSTWIGQYLRF